VVGTVNLGRGLLWSSILIFVLVESLVAVYGAEIGIASTFYDREIACSTKRINPYKTWGIAHKTLPCGTMVEIENLKTHKKIIVPIMDVGPCTSGQCQAGQTAAYRRARKRKFDLLPMVAKAIGSDGLITIGLRAIDH
jgi:hypothetical protein